MGGMLGNCFFKMEIIYIYFFSFQNTTTPRRVLIYSTELVETGFRRTLYVQLEHFFYLKFSLSTLDIDTELIKKKLVELKEPSMSGDDNAL